MTSERRAWAAAFAKQSRSDWEVYELLAGGVVPICHPMHYLQMACEKIGKAYRCRDTEVELSALLSRHVGFEKFMRTLFASPSMRNMFHDKDEQLEVVKRNSLRLAREIEKLAPAVDPGSSPENAEYPWVVDDHISIPCEYSYPNLSLLQSPSGRAFLKLVARAIDEFDESAP